MTTPYFVSSNPEDSII